MSIFIYKAINVAGDSVKGTVEAESQNSAIALLLQKGLTPVDIDDIDTAPGKKNIGIHFEPSAEDILFFVRNFSVALQSGVTVIAALDIMEKDATRKSMKEMITKVGASVRGGSSLSDSFAPFARYFTPAFIGLLKAGEISGSLGKTFVLIGEYLKREFSLKQKLKSAMIYPAILVSASVAVVVLLMVFVLPKLSGAFAQSGVELPIITRVVLSVSNAFTYSIWLDLVILAALIAGFFWTTKSKLGRKKFAMFIEKAPISNKMMRSVALVRFLRTLGNLLISGVSIIEALNTTADSVGHSGVRVAIIDMCNVLESGGQLSSAMEKHSEYFPGVVVGLVRVGEETGKLGQILVEISEFYDDELNYTLRNAMALLEPLLLLGMGIVVGVIALSVLLPIYQLVSKLA